MQVCTYLEFQEENRKTNSPMSCLMQCSGIPVEISFAVKEMLIRSSLSCQVTPACASDLSELLERARG